MLNIQEEGGITRTVEAAARAVYELLPEANSWVRTEQPASKICLAMECGGSDGNSGVTANPALGVAADLLVAQGGRPCWAKRPKSTAPSTCSRAGPSRARSARSWSTGSSGGSGTPASSAPDRQQPVARQQGRRPDDDLRKVAGGAGQGRLDRAGRRRPLCRRGRHSPGLVFMDTPGYDPPCTTGLVAGGANVLVFTTGRGSVLGLKPTPCIKVATNTPMYERMIDDMDLDAGPILEGEPVESVGRRLFEMILDVASGQPDQERAAGRGRRGVRALDHRADTVNAGDIRRRPSRLAQKPGPVRQSLMACRAGASLAIARAGLAGWFLIVPLPNANNTGAANGRRRPRGWLVAQGASASRARNVVPRIASGQRHRRAAPRREPAQRVPILLAAGLIAAAAVGLGDLVAAAGCGVEAGLGAASSGSRWIMAWARACSAS